MFDDVQLPEAAALISFSRYQGKTTLFGSPFVHAGGIRMKIAKAKGYRTLSDTHYMADRLPYIEVDLSYSQFAEAITCMNMGDGAPCTIKYFNGEEFPEVEVKQDKPVFEREGQEAVERCSKELADLLAALDDVKLSKKDKEALAARITKASRAINDSLPFVARQFEEHLEKVEQQAKTDIAAYCDMAVRQTGLAAIQESSTPILEIEGATDEPR